MRETEKNLFLTCADKLPLLNELETYTQTQIKYFILLHKKFLQFDWLRAVVFQLNLKYHSWYLCQISPQIMLLPIQIPLISQVFGLHCKLRREIFPSIYGPSEDP